MAVLIDYTDFHEGQKNISTGLKRRDVIRCGRRFGKTTMLENIAVKRAVKHNHAVGWFVPEYKLMRPTYKRLLDMLYPVVAKSSKTEAFIELSTGGSVEFWTLDNEEAGRSRSYDTVIIDEASLKKTGLRAIVEQAIMPTLLDRGGRLIMAGTPKGIDDESYFYLACTDKSLGWTEWHAPTRDNPTLDPDGVARLQDEYPPLVYRQEYLAEFVDFSGDAMFPVDSLLVEGSPVSPFMGCDAVFAVLDTAVKTGREHDGTAVVYFALSMAHDVYQLVILDYDIVKIEGAFLETWLPGVYANLEVMARDTNARNGSLGTWIEDKASGSILLQQAANRGWVARSIDSRMTAMGKDERAVSNSGYVWRGQVKLTQQAYDRVVTYNETSRNHFLAQVCGFRIGDKTPNRADDLLDAFCYGVAIALGNNEGF